MSIDPGGIRCRSDDGNDRAFVHACYLLKRKDWGMSHYHVDHLHSEAAQRGRAVYHLFDDRRLISHHEAHLEYLSRRGLSLEALIDREGLVSAIEAEMLNRGVNPKEGLEFYSEAAKAAAQKIQRVQTRR
jgi:hypothetical protein